MLWKGIFPPFIAASYLPSGVVLLVGVCHALELSSVNSILTRHQGTDS